MNRFFFSLFFILCLSLSTKAQKLDHKLGEYIVQLEDGGDIKSLIGSHQFFNGKTTELRVKQVISERLNIYHLSFNHNGIHESQFKKAIYSFEDLKLIQFNHFLEQRRTPNDPDFGLQWQWVNANDADIDADQAWDITTGGKAANGKDIVVAIIEDGFLSSSSELSPNQWVNVNEIPENGIDDDGNGFIDDVNGWNVGSNTDDISASSSHGVSVASCVGSVGDNNFGGTGLNWNVKMMIVKFSDFTEAEMLEAYGYILENRIMYNESNGEEGAFVVSSNLSYGATGQDVNEFPIWCGFYDILGENGILNTIATANENINIDDTGDLPTNCSSPYLIGVTSSNNMDERTFDAAFGPINIDVAAPGQNLYMLRSNGEYGFDRGTSFAAPIVAGLVGLSYSVACPAYAQIAIADPQTMADQVRDFIFNGVDPIASLADEVATGGRINAFNSVNLALQNCPACPEASSVEATNVTVSGADLNWTLIDETSIVDLRYKAVSEMDWIETLDAEAPFNLTNLTACTEYEFQLRTTCQDSTLGYSDSFNFTTDGCCEAPGNIVATPNLDSAEVVITWDPVTLAIGYVLRYRIVGLMDNFEQVTVTDTTFTIEPILECMIYEIQVATDCGGNALIFSPSFFWANDDCQTCTDAVYCDAEGRDVSFEFIDSVIFNGNANASGSDNGYGDFAGAAPIAEITPGVENTIRIVPGFTGDAFNELYTVYIDKDFNGVFDSTDQVFLTPSSISGSFEGTFTFPLGTMLGITRMRIMMQGDLNPTEFDPCRDFQFGEVEDYCVKIFFPQECTPPPVDTLTLDGTTFMVWDTVPWDLVYTYRYREEGEEEWIEEATLDTFFMLPFDGCKKYEFQVRAICPSDSSAYTETFIAQASSCVTNSNVEQDAGIEYLTLSPNPFEDNIRIDLKMIEQEVFDITIISAAGQSVFQDRLALYPGINTTTLSLDNLAAGIYFVVFDTDVGKVYRKIIKQ